MPEPTNKQLADELAERVRPGEAARILQVDIRTLQRMAERGTISSVKLPSGHNRYVRSEILALAAGDRPQSGSAAAD